MTHYDTLEISPRASPEVVRAAYRSLIQRCHPDRHPGDEAAARRAAAVTEAYEVLSDAQRRAAYDRSLAAGSARADRLAPTPRREHRARSRWPVVAGSAAAVAVVASAAWLGLPGASPTEHRPSDPRGSVDAQRARQRLLGTVELLDAPLVLQTRGQALTLPRLQAVLGSVDAPAVRDGLQQQRARWQDALARRLAAEDLSATSDARLEARVGRIIAEVLNETLGTRPDEAHAPTAFESPGRSGIVEVRLPDGLTVSG